MLIKNIVFETVFIEISGNFNRDKDLIYEYLQYANAYILCHSFD